jgi:hypothetical protein
MSSGKKRVSMIALRSTSLVMVPTGLCGVGGAIAARAFALD